MRQFLQSPEGIMVLLLLGLFVFTVLVIAVAVLTPTNERLYTYLASTATGFGTAFFTWISKESKGDGRQ